MHKNAPIPVPQRYGVWTLPVTIGAIAVGSAIFFTIAFALLKQQRDVITFAAAAVVAASTVASGYYASATVRQTASLQFETAQTTYETAQRELERETTAGNAARIAASLRIMERWNDPNFNPILVSWRDERKKIRDDDHSVTRDRLAQSVESRAVVQAVLNRLEEMALAVLYKVVDEQVLKEYSETNVLDTFSICREWIKYKQRENPEAWLQLETLYERWRPKTKSNCT
jgi:hypothetical protein